MGFVVAIDGPAASGKGAIAARLGAHLGLPVLDSGLLYRAVAAVVLKRDGDLDDSGACAEAARSLNLANLDDATLRTGAIGEAASRVAVHPAVRKVLTDAQRAFAGRAAGAVIDGRDIGTVIWPAAQVKIFVTASAEARARRRWRELQGQGEPVDHDTVLADIRARDARDSDRAASPLRPATDAVLLDTSDLSIDSAFDAARRIVEAARARSGSA